MLYNRYVILKINYVYMKTLIGIVTFMFLLSSFSLVDARRWSDDSGADDSSSSSSSSSTSSSDDDSDEDSSSSQSWDDDSVDDNSTDDDDDDRVDWVKLRWDGTVDDDDDEDNEDNTGSLDDDDDRVDWVKLRWDGTVDDDDDVRREHRGRVLWARNVSNFDTKVGTLIDILLARGTSDEQDIQLLETAMDKIVGKIDSLVLKTQSVVLKNKLGVLREMTVEKFDEAIVNLQWEIDSILDSIVN